MAQWFFRLLLVAPHPNSGGRGMEGGRDGGAEVTGLLFYSLTSQQIINAEGLLIGCHQILLTDFGRIHFCMFLQTISLVYNQFCSKVINNQV